MTTEQEDFWGDQANWPTQAVPIVTHADTPPVVPPPVDASPTDASPTDVSPTDVSPAEPSTIGSSDDTPVAPVWDDRWSPAESARGRGVDQRLFRLGAVAVIITLIVPVVVGLRSGDADDLVTLATAEATAGTETIEDLAPTASTDLGASPTVAEAVAPPPPTGPTATSAESGPAAAADESSSNGSSASVDTSGSDDAGSTGAPSEETVSAVAAEQVCAIDYEVRSGDFWLRLADGAGVDLDELLDANAASTDTPLYPGRSICLPAGSKTPPPPPALTTGSGNGSTGSSSGSSGSTSGGGSAGSQPTPTAAPKPAPTSPPTTAAPTTTAPPPPPPPPAPEQVEQIIRNVWPDELEDHALEIAWRESNYKANVRNYCCYGLFQIYWSVHSSWLQAMGVGSADQLYDAETNTRAAYALYQRAGGWGPWGG